jgi:hypothetical protein
MQASTLKAVLAAAYEAVGHPEIKDVEVKEGSPSHPAGAINVRFVDGSAGHVYLAAVVAPGGQRLNQKDFQLPGKAL